MQVAQHHRSPRKSGRAGDVVAFLTMTTQAARNSKSTKHFKLRCLRCFGRSQSATAAARNARGGVAQDEMTHMVGRPQGARLRRTAAGPGVLMWNRPVGRPE